MDTYYVANVLYNMCLDMDYADHIEHAEEEIAYIEKSIKDAIEAGADSLVYCLENIALLNDVNYHLFV